jgi:hypothetical protein
MGKNKGFIIVVRPRHIPMDYLILGSKISLINITMP